MFLDGGAECIELKPGHDERRQTEVDGMIQEVCDTYSRVSDLFGFNIIG